jgi:hypothetical protein
MPNYCTRPLTCQQECCTVGLVTDELMITIQIPAPLHKRLKVASAELGVPVRQLVARWLGFAFGDDGALSPKVKPSAKLNRSYSSQKRNGKAK